MDQSTEDVTAAQLSKGRRSCSHCCWPPVVSRVVTEGRSASARRRSATRAGAALAAELVSYSLGLTLPAAQRLLVPMLAFDVKVAEQRVLDDLLPHLAG